MTEMTVIDISFRGVGLERDLSNLVAYPFMLDGVFCGSMEGFLQSLKFTLPHRKREIAALDGAEAWRNGQTGNDWQDTQILFWDDVAYPRLSKKYHGLLARAYDTCVRANDTFAEALRQSGDALLVHTRGKHNPTNTVLTEYEYIYNLNRLRHDARQLR